MPSLPLVRPPAFAPPLAAALAPGTQDRISEIRLRAAQPLIETPDLLSGTQRTGKPSARWPPFSGYTPELSKYKFDPTTLDAEEGVLLQA